MILGLSLSANATADRWNISRSDWIRASEIAGVDSSILYAISLTESGYTFKGTNIFEPWPWTINVNSKDSVFVKGGHYFITLSHASRMLDNAVGHGVTNIDVGMFQVNIKWNGHLVGSARDLLIPNKAIYVASQVLNNCSKQGFENIKEKLSCYNAGKVNDRGLQYAKRVLKYNELYASKFTIANLLAEQKDEASKVGTHDGHHFMASLKKK